MALFFGQWLVLHDLQKRERNRRSRLFHRHIRDAQNPFEIRENEFVRHFRLSREAFRELMHLVEGHMEDGQRPYAKIPKVYRVLAALNFFATGSYQRSVASNVLACCSQSVVSRSIQEITNIILRHVQRYWVRFPRSDEERRTIKAEFYRRHRMHHIVGVVDGTHIAIFKPRENEHVYVNRKGYHSLNCQIICDADLRIINIKASYPGSTHDAFVWRNSRIGQVMRANFENEDEESFIMGDSGYPCLPWLLVPVTNPETNAEARFNERFKRCRSVVERCIGVLKGRFRCLLKDRTLHYSPRTAAKITLTCVVLHNIAVAFHVDDPVPMWDEMDRELPLPLDFPEQDQIYRQRGRERRQRYIRQYFNNN